MKLFNTLILSLFAGYVIQASEEQLAVQPISETEAAAIVQAQEEARERAKDLREQELRNADVRASAIATVGNREVLFNVVDHVAPERADVGRSSTKLDANTDLGVLSAGVPSAEKEYVQITLSGTVWDESISELWWDYEGNRYRIFVNANFLLFPGLGEFEDNDARYSLFTMITGRSTSGKNPEIQEWRPTLADFSSGGLEYIVANPKADSLIDPAAFAGIEAMLRYYAANHEEMRIRYENSQKLREARAAYLEAHPPKERDTIINFRPRKETTNRLSIGN